MATSPKQEDDADSMLTNIITVLKELSCVDSVDKSEIEVPYTKKRESEARPVEKQLTEVPVEGTSVDPPTPEILPPQTHPAFTERHSGEEIESAEYKVTGGSNKSDIEQKPCGDPAAGVESFEYNFQHKFRGLFLLFNVVSFANQKDLKREGTDADAELLEQTFKNLGFKVLRYNDPTKNEMIKWIKTVASHDHSDIDCVAVGILTHGTWGLYRRPDDGDLAIADQIMASDERFQLEEITSLLRIKNSHPSLNGKPKLVFIQACRGENLAEGVEYQDRIHDNGNVPVVEKIHAGQPIHQTDSPDERSHEDDVLNTPTPQAFSPDPPLPSNLHDEPEDDGDGLSWVDRQGHCLPESMPIYKDFLVAWSTAPGFFSFRNVDNGSVFIQTLCHYLDEFHETADLLSIVTWANSDIAHQYETYAPSTVNDPRKRNIHCKKQMPWFFSRLTKDVYFRTR